MKTLFAVLLGLVLSAQAGATVRYFHWDKPHHGNRGNVTALDLSTGKVVWEVSAGKIVNFVHDCGSGIAVGNDEPHGSGSERIARRIWRRRPVKR